jgi:hypothetical protein
MQQTGGTLIPHRQPGSETSSTAGRAMAASALRTADDVVKARISAAIAGAAVPLSVTSAPNAVPYPTLAEAGPQAASTQPGHEKFPELPQYPPLGRSGSRLERVEPVSRFTRPRVDWHDAQISAFDHGAEQAVQFNNIADAAAQSAEPEHELLVIDTRDEGDIYRRLISWLRTHKQATALRELAQLRRVLVLVPADKLGQSWQAHLMCPAAPPAHAMITRPPGAEGRSWPLHAEGAWALTKPAGGWQHWRMRQHLRADGAWQLEQSSEDSNTPAWCLDGGPQLLPVPVNGIPLHLTEPQRLRRLLGTQWTVLVLRAPQPLP